MPLIDPELDVLSPRVALLMELLARVAGGELARRGERDEGSGDLDFGGPGTATAGELPRNGRA